MEDKVPLNIVQGILGHSSIETTRKYLHKNEDIEREAIGMMSDYLNMGQMDTLLASCFLSYLNNTPKPDSVQEPGFVIFRSCLLVRQPRKAVKRQHSNQNFRNALIWKLCPASKSKDSTGSMNCK